VCNSSGQFFWVGFELIKILFKNPVDYKEYRGAVLNSHNRFRA
jgi:hypothetical protein